METPLTPLEFARRSRKLYAGREAVVDGDRRMTYEQFFERCDRWSAVLQQQLGVEKGDRVALISPNTHAMLEAFYSVPQLGAVVVPLNYRLTIDDFIYMVEHSGATILCVHGDYVDHIDEARGRFNCVRHFVAFENARAGWVDYEKAVACSCQEFSRPDIDENDLLSINYTSGTTSRPKGVMITHRNAWVNSIGTLIHQPMTMANRYLWTLPMFHANGWTYVWTVTAVGATHICLRKVEAEKIYELIDQEHVDVLCAAPTVLIMIANAPSEMRCNVHRSVRVITGGASPAAATIERFEQELGWQIRHVYGLTETSPFISMWESRPEDLALSNDALARAKARQGVEMITSGELSVIDESGHEVPWDGKTLGEVTARGNVVMKGYYRDKEATEDALRDGWFRSGDAAVIHPDGYMEIRDRFKDVIVSGGENISSIEVEGVLIRHPAVAEVAVVGVPHEKWGETPLAFVATRQGGSVIESEIIAYCRERIAHYKVPTKVIFLSELPKTATGKIQKFLLRSSYTVASNL